MGLGYELVKEWARANKSEVCDIARRYSGSFVIAFINAFVYADKINTEKMLKYWEDEFKKLYQFSDTNKYSIEKAEHDFQEDVKEEE